MDNLIKRRVIQLNAQLCAGGCGNPEDVNHLFISCEFFEKISFDISNWLGVTKVHPTHVSYHLLQFRALGGFSKNIQLSLTLGKFE